MLTKAKSKTRHYSPRLPTTTQSIKPPIHTLLKIQLSSEIHSRTKKLIPYKTEIAPLNAFVRSPTLNSEKRKTYHKVHNSSRIDQTTIIHDNTINCIDNRERDMSNPSPECKHIGRDKSNTGIKKSKAYTRIISKSPVCKSQAILHFYCPTNTPNRTHSTKKSDHVKGALSLKLREAAENGELSTIKIILQSYYFK